MTTAPPIRWTICVAFLVFAACSLSVRAGDTENTQPPPAATVADEELDDDEPFDDPFAEEDGEIADPLESVNRVIYRFNDRLYFWCLKPAATGYSRVVPEPARISVRRFFKNIASPVRMVNHLLQGDLKSSATETKRLLVNTTIGIGGLFDPAQDWLHIEPVNTDTDDTLAQYGLGHGCYLVLPVLGPSSLRHSTGLVGDHFLRPWSYLGDNDRLISGTQLAIRTGMTVNNTSLRLGEYEDFVKNAFDPYTAMKDAFYQNRKNRQESALDPYTAMKYAFSQNRENRHE